MPASIALLVLFCALSGQAAPPPQPAPACIRVNLYGMMIKQGKDPLLAVAALKQKLEQMSTRSATTGGQLTENLSLNLSERKMILTDVGGDRWTLTVSNTATGEIQVQYSGWPQGYEHKFLDPTLAEHLKRASDLAQSRPELAASVQNKIFQEGSAWIKKRVIPNLESEAINAKQAAADEAKLLAATQKAVDQKAQAELAAKAAAAERQAQRDAEKPAASVSRDEHAEASRQAQIRVNMGDAFVRNDADSEKLASVFEGRQTVTKTDSLARSSMSGTMGSTAKSNTWDKDTALRFRNRSEDIRQFTQGATAPARKAPKVSSRTDIGIWYRVDTPGAPGSADVFSGVFVAHDYVMEPHTIDSEFLRVEIHRPRSDGGFDVLSYTTRDPALLKLYNQANGRVVTNAASVQKDLLDRVLGKELTDRLDAIDRRAAKLLVP